MKRLFLIGVMVLTAVAGFAQSGERIDTLKERQKVLKITTKLNKLQLDYEKEKANNIELSKKAADINVEANIATTESTQLTHQTLLRMQRVLSKD